MDLVGHQVGAYRILSLLGRGGTAEVYKAFHPALKREVAVKVILKEVSRDVDWVRRFKQEAELLGRLDHPHILPIYDAGEHEGRAYLVMKYMVDGTPLRTRLSGQPWPLNRVVKVLNQVADALDAAHEAGVVHRDIKPSNILVTPELRCLVFDFGIAKPFRKEEATTGSGLIVGTPEFMSPEQCRGEKIDHRSDVYSLGVMTYQMLSGHVPFTAETAVGILMKHLTEPLPIPPKGVALPPAVSGVLQKALSREPADRFASAGEFARAFHESADQRATVTLHATDMRRVSTPTLKLPPWVRKVKAKEFRMTAAATVLVAMLTGIYALWPSGPTAAPPPARNATTEAAPFVEAAHVEPTPPAEPAPEPEESSPSVTSSAGSERTIAPVPTSATLRVESNEAANVLLNGQSIGTAPGAFEAVKPGRYTLVLDAGAGRVQEKTIVVTAGSTHHVRFDFTPTPANGGELQEGPYQSEGVSIDSTSLARQRELASPPQIREWTGYLTDEDCRYNGGKQKDLHLRCAERCIREGKQPMLYSRGKLYRLEGFENIELVRGGPLRFKGWLEVDTLHVAAR